MIRFQRGRLLVRDYQSADLKAMNDVRDIDREDISNLFSMTPEESISVSSNNSTHVFSVLWKGEMIAVLGLKPETLLSNSALVWMVTTNKINDVKIAFVRASRYFIQDLLSYYSHLHGIVRNENVCSLQWLKWLGANMIENDFSNFHYFSLGGN